MGAPEESPVVTIQALRTPDDPHTLIVALGGVIGRVGAARVGDSVVDLLHATEPTLLICDLAGLTEPNAATVDVICRVRLATRRVGCRMRVRGASPDLIGLLDLMGLCDVIEDGSSDAGSGLEREGQPEEREHARGVEEEGDPDDPVT